MPSFLIIRQIILEVIWELPDLLQKMLFLLTNSVLKYRIKKFEFQRSGNLIECTPCAKVRIIYDKKFLGKYGSNLANASTERLNKERTNQRIKQIHRRTVRQFYVF